MWFIIYDCVFWSFWQLEYLNFQAEGVCSLDKTLFRESFFYTSYCMVFKCGVSYMTASFCQCFHTTSFFFFNLTTGCSSQLRCHCNQSNKVSCPKCNQKHLPKMSRWAIGPEFLPQNVRVTKWSTVPVQEYHSNWSDHSSRPQCHCSQSGNSFYPKCNVNQSDHVSRQKKYHNNQSSSFNSKCNGKQMDYISWVKGHSKQSDHRSWPKCQFWPSGPLQWPVIRLLIDLLLISGCKFGRLWKWRC